MPHRKNTIKIVEVGTFFKNSTKEALKAIYEVLTAIRITDCGLGLSSFCNAVHKTSEKLLLCLLFPLFRVANPYNFPGSALAQRLPAGKDQFYRLLNDGGIDWRGVGYRVFGRLKKLLEKRGESAGPTCLIADDSDLPKTGRRMEMIGKVFSHVSHGMILGFKMLTLAYSDGKTLLPVDFSLHGEKGKIGNYGMKPKDLKKRHEALHKSGNPDSVRVAEYDKSKIGTLMEMVRRFTRHGYKADYLLTDSWFVCDELVKFISRLKAVKYLLGMAKMGNTKYAVDGKEMTAKQIINATKRKKNSKMLRYRYFVKKAELKGTPVLLFFCKRNRNDNWNVLLSTNLDLTFEQAYKIYATRWSIEVYFKEGKQLLNLGGCQSQGFNSQIAAATIVQLQYSILSVAKRFGSYETLGALFRDTEADVVEQTLNERIWICICQIISELADFLGLDEEKLMSQFIADNQTFTKLINLEPLLQAG